MSVHMIGRELDEIVRELYALPPTDFVAARNELVRQARAAGGKDVAERLQQLRRPTRSAWLVNLLARDPTAMQRLSALGRELRDAQTGLARTELRNLAEQRRLLIADLLDRTRAHAADAGVRLTPTVLSEVEATLQAALVDLAGAMTIRNGRLVRPLTHSGFGPRPRMNVPQVSSTIELRPVEVPAEAAAETERPPVEDELEARRQRRALGARWTVELVEVTDDWLAEYDDAGKASETGGSESGAPESEGEKRHELRLAEEALAAAEAAHWQSEFDLADAEAAVEAADDVVNSLDTRRIEARRDKVTAQRHLTEAQARQRAAVNALAEARQRLDAARQLAGTDE
jgi:hypothetical protein